MPNGTTAFHIAGDVFKLSLKSNFALNLSRIKSILHGDIRLKQKQMHSSLLKNRIKSLSSLMGIYDINIITVISLIALEIES